MAVVSYSDLQGSINLVKSRSKVLDTDLIETMLEDTAGYTQSLVYDPLFVPVKIYRPYYIASVLLDQKLTQVIKAEGAEFRDLGNNVIALRNYQWALDSNLFLKVPDNTSESHFASLSKKKMRSIPITPVFPG